MLADYIGVPQLRDLAGRSEHVSETITTDSMPRLAGLLYSSDAGSVKPLGIELRFAMGAEGFPEVNGHINGSVSIVCQRCLGQLNWPVDLDFRLIVVDREADSETVAEPFDAVVAGEHGIALGEVIEDELLGALPLAPVHETLEECEQNVGQHLIKEDVGEEQEQLNTPFAGLADLLGKET